jgi:hypothetical protein
VLAFAPGARLAGFCRRDGASAVSGIVSLSNRSYRAFDMTGRQTLLPRGLNQIPPDEVLDAGHYGGGGSCDLLRRDPASEELRSTNIFQNGVATRSFGVPAAGWSPVGVGYGRP